MIDDQQKNNVDQTNEENNGQGPKACCAELQDFKNKYIYLNAEFDNYRKRIDKEKKQWVQFGEETVLKSVVTLVDDLDRAFSQLESLNISDELKSQFQGFKLILKSAHNILSKSNVEEIKSNIFNPEEHEAIAQVESEKHKPGEIVEVYEKGYKHNDRLLRPAKVSVAK